jgi:hypothetical protein
MAKIINTGPAPKDPKNEKQIPNNSESKSPKEKQNITIIKGQLSQDLKDLITALGLSPDSTKDFFIKLGDIVSSGTGVIDFQERATELLKIIIDDKSKLTPIELQRNIETSAKIVSEIDLSVSNEDPSQDDEIFLDQNDETNNKNNTELDIEQNTNDAKYSKEISAELNNLNSAKTEEEVDTELNENSSVKNESNIETFINSEINDKVGDTLVFNSAENNNKEDSEVELVDINTNNPKARQRVNFDLSDNDNKQDDTVQINKGTTLQSNFVPTEDNNQKENSDIGIGVTGNKNNKENSDIGIGVTGNNNNKQDDLIQTNKGTDIQNNFVPTLNNNQKENSNIGVDVVANNSNKQDDLIQTNKGTDIQNNFVPTEDNNQKENSDIDVDINLNTSNKISTEINVDRMVETLQNASRASRTSQNVLDLTLYNLIPYALSSAVSSATRFLENFDGDLNLNEVPSAILNIFNTGKTALSSLNKIKYFTLAELGLLATANFATLQFTKVGEITIKDLLIGPSIPFSEAGNTLRINSVFGEKKLKTKKYFLGIFDTDPEIQAIKTKSGDKVQINLSNLKNEYMIERVRSDDQTLFDRLKSKSDSFKIGSIYVWPIVDSSENVTPKHIPFQFNPVISDGGQSARYESMSILSRLGNLQSYVGTDSLNITLTTKYIATSYKVNDENKFSDSHKDGWLGLYDMRTVQLIELAYRALILPYFTPNSTDTGYKYFKPPLVKVIFGDHSGGKLDEISIQNRPFSNMLVYPKDILEIQGASRLTGQPNFRYFRTFIVTNVTIQKNLEETPIFIDINDGYLAKDTMGFEVNLSMIEVTPSYADVQPGFYEYYKVITGEFN